MADVTTVKLFLVGAATVLAISTGCSKDSSAAPGGASSSAAVASGSAEVTSADEPVPLSVGPHVEGKNFKLDFALVGDCKSGAECTAKIQLEALGDYHINKEYPYKFKAEGTGVELLGKDAAGKNVFSKGAGDFVIDAEKHATLTVRFKPLKPGPARVAGQYKMSVCSAQNCQLETQEIALDVVAK